MMKAEKRVHAGSRFLSITMSSAAFQPRLRLVGGEEFLFPTTTADEFPSAAELSVVKENRLAAHAGPVDANAVDAHDPRWILAMQTQARLQGATLTPERRDEVIASGKRLGLRPFESNLIIAIVQDQARHPRAKPSLRIADSTLAIMKDACSSNAESAKRRSWRWWMAAIGCGVMLAGIIIRWISAST